MSTASIDQGHAPVLILSPDGTGVRSVIACSCGEQPKTGAQTGSTMHRWFYGHRRLLGLPRLDNVAHATYATGYGYAAEGLTWDQWYAISSHGDPFAR